MVGEERHVPYERPPLSKELLTTEESFEKTYLNPAAFYEEQNIELRLGAKAEGIDAKAHRLVLGDGEALAYDKLLLTTGARVRRLDLPGAELGGVLYLRSIEDSLAIKKELVAGASIVVIGGGYIGLEVAAGARTNGCEVAVIELQDVLLG